MIGDGTLLVMFDAEAELERARLALLDARRASAAVERDEASLPVGAAPSALTLLVEAEVERATKAFAGALKRRSALVNEPLKR